MFKVRVSGLREVDAMLARLGPTLGPATMTLALQVAAEPLVTAAKSLAPYDEERTRGKHLRDSIGAHTKLKRSQRAMMSRPGFAFVFVGPDTSAPHAHLLEYGHVMTVNRGRNKGQEIRHVPAYPFMRPAWDLTRAEVLERLRRQVHDVLASTARAAHRSAWHGTLDQRVAASINAGA